MYKKINIYGYPYNVPGFEMFYLKQVLPNKIKNEVVSMHMDNQIKLTYDESSFTFGVNCFDKTTINYRIYEYYKGLEERDYISKS